MRLPRGDGSSFAQAALRHGVAVLPGTALDPSGGSAECLRISYLAEPPVLREAAARLATAWQGYEGGRSAPAPVRAIVV